MEKNKNRYIDLSRLPRITKNNYIDWKNSIGYNIPFVYDNVQGEIKIVGYVDEIKETYRNPHILITIDHYVPNPIKIQVSTIRRGLLHKLVGNKIINTDKNMIKYLVDPSSAYTITYGSSQLLKMRCPICGSIYDKVPSVVHTYGFSCPVCGDGYSIPNKLMRNILMQLELDFIPEVNKKHFDWMDKYKYDFYLQIDGNDILIEMDGGYHKLQHETDAVKDKLAQINNFKLIRIDCDYHGNPLDYIRNNIVKCELNTILDLKNINWEQCKYVLADSMIHDICKLWEESELSVVEITNRLKLNRITVATYLGRGHDLGLCNSFNHEESVYRSSNPYLMVLKDGVVFGVFRHVHQLCNQSIAVFGQQFHLPSVRACYNKTQTYKGFNIQTITREEYEQYKMINNNEVV
jgi:very-short-patch-repair endonuclease